MKNAVGAMLLALTLLSSVSIAQSPTEATTSSSQTGAQLPSSPQGAGRMQSPALTSSGSGMEAAITRMAGMCEQMMKQEMAMMPYKLAVGIGLGILLTLALLLLIVLEVQWIIAWSRG
ncbi:MAG: hypothetical protein V4729_09045 [Pseudomonadota bacterium]